MRPAGSSKAPRRRRGVRGQSPLGLRSVPRLGADSLPMWMAGLDYSYALRRAVRRSTASIGRCPRRKVLGRTSASSPAVDVSSRRPRRTGSSTSTGRARCAPRRHVSVSANSSWTPLRRSLRASSWFLAAVPLPRWRGDGPGAWRALLRHGGHSATSRRRRASQSRAHRLQPPDVPPARDPVATDVSNPLCGPQWRRRASMLPRWRDAGPRDQLEAALFRYAQVARRHFGFDSSPRSPGGEPRAVWRRARGFPRDASRAGSTSLPRQRASTTDSPSPTSSSPVRAATTASPARARSPGVWSMRPERRARGWSCLRALQSVRPMWKFGQSPRSNRTRTRRWSTRPKC